MCFVFLGGVGFCRRIECVLFFLVGCVPFREIECVLCFLMGCVSLGESSVFCFYLKVRFSLFEYRVVLITTVQLFKLLTSLLPLYFLSLMSLFYVN